MVVINLPTFDRNGDTESTHVAKSRHSGNLISEGAADEEVSMPICFGRTDERTDTIRMGGGVISSFARLSLRTHLRKLSRKASSRVLVLSLKRAMLMGDPCLLDIFPPSQSIDALSDLLQNTSVRFGKHFVICSMISRII